jgi:hypothetical protein
MMPAMTPEIPRRSVQEEHATAAALIETYGLEEAARLAQPMQLDLSEALTWDVLTRDRIVIDDEDALRRTGLVVASLDYRRIRAELRDGKAVQGARFAGREYVMPANRITLYCDRLRAQSVARTLGMAQVMGLDLDAIVTNATGYGKDRLDCYDEAALRTNGYTTEAVDFDRLRKVMNACIPITGARFDGVEFILRPRAERSPR